MPVGNTITLSNYGFVNASGCGAPGEASQVGSWKFLQRAVQDNKRNILKIVKAEAKVG